MYLCLFNNVINSYLHAQHPEILCLILFTGFVVVVVFAHYLILLLLQQRTKFSTENIFRQENKTNKQCLIIQKITTLKKRISKTKGIHNKESKQTIVFSALLVDIRRPFVVTSWNSLDCRIRPLLVDNSC